MRAALGFLLYNIQVLGHTGKWPAGYVSFLGLFEHDYILRIGILVFSLGKTHLTIFVMY